MSDTTRSIETIPFPDAIRKLNLNPCEHLTFDPDLTIDTGAQFEIIRSMTTDGTLFFVRELMKKAIAPLINKTTFFLPEGYENVVDRKYTVGNVTLEAKTGMVDLPVGHVMGDEITVRIPVICQQIRRWA